LSDCVHPCPCGYYGDSTELLYLRARQYDPSMGRFLTQDTWDGNSTLPITYNKWVYANANPILYTDPSGHCFFGIDTAFCIAVLVGVPAIAGVTTASWDYYVTQGHGVGGINEFNPACVDWGQVFGAGKSGSFGAIEPFAMMPASVILTPSYLLGYLRYGMTPGEVNEFFINQVGLGNVHNQAMQNPYYVSGRAGGSIGTLALSLHLTLTGLPTLTTGPGTQLSGYNTLVLSGANVTAVGGDLSLIYTGTSGLASSGLVMMSSGGGGEGRGPQNNLRGKIGEAQVRKMLENKFTYLGNRVTVRLPNGKIRFVDHLVQDPVSGKIFAVEVKTGLSPISGRQQSLDTLMASQGGILERGVPPRYLNLRLSSIETIYFRLPSVNLP